MGFNQKKHFKSNFNGVKKLKMSEIKNKVHQPEIYNVDILEKSLDKIYMDFIYMEAKIELMKKEILEMKDWLELEKDMWKYNG